MNVFKTTCCIFSLALISIFSTSFTKGGDDKELDPETFYSMGEVKAMSADSIPYGTYVALTKEVMDKKNNIITMKSITIDQKGETVEYNYTMNINDPKFVVKDVDGNYSGVGKLHGKKWKWTSWDYSLYYTNPAGGRMEAFNYISLVGLVVNKAFYDANGKMLVRYKEHHKFITKEEFEILYLQVLKCSTK
ncbi:MAG: hypothetical protein JWP12_3590 [Bacteroidetes bacterium]|nr:hypothetical protein [Bacteroidota bacterium]